MLLNSTTGLVILGLVLVAGWLLGLASSTGGKKWKTRYLAERDAHAAYRKDADTRVADADRRHTELEREHATFRTEADRRAAEHDRRHADLERERPAHSDVHAVTPQAAARPAGVHSADIHPSDRPAPIGSTVITPNRSRDGL
jgi:hypothetical protein